MYAPTRSKKELEALSEFGFSESDFDKVIEIWPENVAAVNLFSSLQTQWYRDGMGVAYGLNYGVLFHKMDRMKLSPSDYKIMEEDISVLELAALAAMNKKD